MEITKLQISQMHAILSKKGLMDQKREIVGMISKGRTFSMMQLTQWEAQMWINAMNKATTQPKSEDPRQKMINRIIAIAREMGVVQRKNFADANGQLKHKSDYSRLNEWMKEKSYLKKPLNQYTYEELPTLVSQYNNIYISWLNKSKNQQQ